MQSPCARLVRVMFPTLLPRRYARRLRRTREGRGVRYARSILFCAHHAPHFIAQALRAGAAAYARRPRRKLRSHDFVLCASCPPLHCPGATRGGRGVRAEAAACATFTRSSTRITYAKRAWSRLVCIMSPTILPRRYAPAISVQSPYFSSFRVASYCRRVDLVCD
jgi:hypothetical protein